MTTQDHFINYAKYCLLIESMRKTIFHLFKKQAQNKWQQNISTECVNQILSLSELHPYYLNLICNYFWTNNIIPTTTAVTETWHNHIEIERSFIASDIAKLSNNQKNYP